MSQTRLSKLLNHGWLTSYNVLALFTAVCVAVSTFWPYVAGYDNTFLEISPVRQSLVSVENLISSSISITLAVPLLIDTLMDGVVELLFHAKQKVKAKKHNNKEDSIVNVCERLCMCFGFIINPANALGALHSRSHNVALFAFCCTRARHVSVIGGIVLSFSRNQNDIMSTRVAAFIIGLLTISMSVIGFLTLEARIGGPLQTFGEVLQYTVVTAFYLPLVWFMIRGYYRFRKPISLADVKPNKETSAPANKTVAHLGGIFFQSHQEDSSSDGSSNDGAGKESLYFSLTYCATVMLCFVAILVTFAPGSGSKFAGATPATMALQHVGYTVLELGVLVFHLRQVKFAAVTRLVSGCAACCWLLDA
jgi:hypothetical protein